MWLIIALHRFRHVSARPRARAWLLTLTALILLAPTLVSCAAGTGIPKRTAQPHPFLILLCKASDIPAVPHDLAFYQSLFLDKTPGVHNVYDYFVDQSYGAATIDGTVIKDWLSTTQSTADLNALKDKDHPNWWRGPLSKTCFDEFKNAKKLSDVKVADFLKGGIITIWNLEGADGGAFGFMDDGVGYPSVNAGAGAAPGENSVSFFTHEMLHNLGVNHAHGPYPGYPEANYLHQEADAGTTHTFGTALFEEYGDCWTIMGCGGWVIKSGPLWGDEGPELGAAQRDQLGWIPGSRVLLWGGATTTVSVAPANRPDIDGFLLVKIALSPSVVGGECCAFYTVEYIEKSGWNAKIAMDHAVLIHEIRPGDPTHTYLVSRTVYGAWLPGQVFLDTANHVRLSIDSYGDAATITLSMSGAPDAGTITCTPPGFLDGSGVTSAPSLKIEAPLDSTHAVAGYPVTLQVSAIDPTLVSHPPVADKVPEDRINWMANGTPIGTGSSLTHTFTTPGDYAIQVAAYDSYCVRTTSSVTLHVDPPPPSPTVVILQPVNGQEYLVGPPSFAASVTLVASGSSTITSYDWLDDAYTGYLASGDHASAVIPLHSTSHNCVVEPHTITLRGKATTGEIATASVTITLKTDCIR